jgi:two-component system sensor histidine kinase KdpD
MTIVNETARQEPMTDIQSAAGRLNRLVENLLDMSRLESGRLQLKRDWCDLSEIVAVAIQRVRVGLEGHPLTITVAPDLPLIRADFVLIEQVLVNLLDNICNYTPPSTSVTIRVEMEDKLIKIVVEDDGPGIPPEALKHLFDKFYRVPGTNTGGTGLGLSISRGLVEAHGGTISLESVLEQGTCFTIRLPLGDTPPPVQEAEL